MKLKYIIGSCVLVVVGLLCTVFYYGFDPALLTKLSFYVNLANPYVRIVKVDEGLRKEEIADVIGNKLNWSEGDKRNFISAYFAKDSASLEGHYFPQTYFLDKDASPLQVSTTMFDEFSKQTSKIKKPKSKQIINEDTILKIASIIQREAAGKYDMKLISGIIWNRIFSGMKLQIDSTLQYAKGNEENGWWTEVDPADKKLKSAYNTYLYAGLPPAAISNPGLAAIDAAYNPTPTTCLFFLHDRNRQIHCAKTYEEHKQNIINYY